MQNALLNVPAHDFDELVVDRRSSKNVVTEVRDNSHSSSPRRDYYDEDPEPRGHYRDYDEPSYNEPSYYDSESSYRDEPSTYRYSEPEPVREPEPEPIREPEPEPVYREPEPIYSEPVYNEPAPVIDDAPSFDDESSKGRN